MVTLASTKLAQSFHSFRPLMTRSPRGTCLPCKPLPKRLHPFSKGMTLRELFVSYLSWLWLLLLLHGHSDVHTVR